MTAVRQQRQPAMDAGFGARAGALVLDLAYLKALLWSISTVLAGAASHGWLPWAFKRWAGNWAWLLIGLLYFVGLTGLVGRTLGKRAFGLKVVAFDGRPVDLWSAAPRAAYSLVSAALFGAGFLPAAFSKSKRALHDLLSGTRVIQAGAPLPLARAALAASLIFFISAAYRPVRTALDNYSFNKANTAGNGMHLDHSGLQSAIGNYYADNAGRYPASLDDGTFTPKYYPGIPLEYSSRSREVHTKFDGSGGWFYDPVSGEVWPNVGKVLPPTARAKTK